MCARVRGFTHGAQVIRSLFKSVSHFLCVETSIPIPGYNSSDRRGNGGGKDIVPTVGDELW